METGELCIVFPHSNISFLTNTTACTYPPLNPYLIPTSHTYIHP